MFLFCHGCDVRYLVQYVESFTTSRPCRLTHTDKDSLSQLMVDRRNPGLTSLYFTSLSLPDSHFTAPIFSLRFLSLLLFSVSLLLTIPSFSYRFSFLLLFFRWSTTLIFFLNASLSIFVCMSVAFFLSLAFSNLYASFISDFFKSKCVF